MMPLEMTPLIDTIPLTKPLSSSHKVVLNLSINCNFKICTVVCLGEVHIVVYTVAFIKSASHKKNSGVL